MPESPEFLRPAEAAEILRCSQRKVYRLIEEKRIPHVQFGDRGVRIPRAALMSWAADRTVQAQ